MLDVRVIYHEYIVVRGGGMYKAHIKDTCTQSNKEHSINVAEKAAEFLSGIGLSASGYLSGLCHDIGKYTEEFQEYLRRATNGQPVKKGSVIHTFAGVKLLLDRFSPIYGSNSVGNIYDMIVAEILATAVGSHHGLFDALDLDGKSGLSYRHDRQPQYDDRAIAAFLSEIESEQDIDDLFQKSKDEITEILAKCIDIAKMNDARKDDCRCFYFGFLQRVINSAVMDGDRTDTAEFMQGISYDKYTQQGNSELWTKAINHLETYIDSFPCNTDIQKARRELSDICASSAKNPGGIYRLNMPTGAGKTLSSLRYALIHAEKFGKKRIFMTVPLLSVLDQNIDVIRTAVGNDDIILEHHSDVITDRMEYEELQRYDILTETWNSPIIATTFVQLLNALFSGKSSCVRRFHSLSESVIVIDEVQNVPEKMISLFILAINFLSKICGATIVLCSATQPNFEDNTFKLLVDGDIVNPEQLAKYNKVFKRTKTVYSGLMSIEEIAERAIRLCEENGNSLVICNTKNEAYSLCDEISNAGVYCVYLSTALCMAHRKAKLREVSEMLQKGEKVICVSTQLIEAGVDISFASVVRLTAGIDNVAQAAGRCNRHGEKDGLAPVEIITLKGEKLSFLKEIEDAKILTIDLTEEIKRNPEEYESDMISEPAIRFFYKCKAKNLNEQHLGKTEYHVSRGGTILSLLSQNVLADDKEGWIMRQAYKTAGESFRVFDNDNRAFLVPYNKEAESIINDIYDADSCGDFKAMKRLLKRAKPYIVQVFEYQYKRLAEAGAVVEVCEGAVSILQSGYYDEEAGVINPQKTDTGKIDKSYIF